MSPLSVSADRLHCRTVRTRDRVIRGATLFPFFDRQGRVASVMPLTPESPEIYWLGWRPKRFRVPLWGAIRLSIGTESLKGITEEDMKTLSSLWHYDPWWMLADEPYSGNPAVPCLKATNCPRRFSEKVTAVHFERDLSRLTGVTIDKDNGGSRTQAWKADLLPAREVPAP